MVDQAVSKFGGIDIIVNNAGIDPAYSILETSEDIWDKVMAVNLKGPFLFSKYAVPEIIKRGGGSVINIGSTSSLFGHEKFAPIVPQREDYCF